jgi:malonate-semialdehyde dehydrogenase (acetylating)/methylmalonate-semialdehyde dehydrogenase
MTPSPPPRLLSSAAGGVAPGPPRALDGADWIDPRTGLYRIFTDNAFVSVVGDGGGGGAPSPSSGRFQVVNPANQDVLGTVLDAAASSSSPPLLDELVRKGREAHEGWRAVPVQRRQRVLADYALLVKEATPLLAELICLENGKTLADARGDVFRGLEVVESSAGAASRMLGSSLLNLAEGVDCASYRVPVGVCAAVCPFNFPAMASP